MKKLMIKEAIQDTEWVRLVIIPNESGTDKTSNLCDQLGIARVAWQGARKHEGKYYVSVKKSELDRAKTAIENWKLFSSWEYDGRNPTSERMLEYADLLDIQGLRELVLSFVKWMGDDEIGQFARANDITTVFEESKQPTTGKLNIKED